MNVGSATGLVGALHAMTGSFTAGFIPLAMMAAICAGLVVWRDRRATAGDEPTISNEKPHSI